MRKTLITPLAMLVLLAAGCSTGSETVQTETEPTAQTETVQTEPKKAEKTEKAETAQTPATTTEVADTTASAESTGQLAVFVENGVAIRGADPVAYFTESAYVPGSEEFAYEWDGATWYFASAENQALFAESPELYAPEYGGFCAWAVSQGYTAPVDPTAWKIVDNKLYLNYDKRIQARWERDISGHIAQADQNWPGVLTN